LYQPFLWDSLIWKGPLYFGRNLVSLNQLFSWKESFKSTKSPGSSLVVRIVLELSKYSLFLCLNRTVLLIASWNRLSRRSNCFARIAMSEGVLVTLDYGSVCHIGIDSSIGRMCSLPATRYAGVSFVERLTVVRSAYNAFARLST
jgi:hypothetical protein